MVNLLINVTINDARNEIIISESPYLHTLDNIIIDPAGGGSQIPPADIGIAIHKSAAIIQNSSIRADKAIFLCRSTGSIMQNDPNILFEKHGIFAWQTDFLVIIDNFTGTAIK